MWTLTDISRYEPKLRNISPNYFVKLTIILSNKTCDKIRLRNFIIARYIQMEHAQTTAKLMQKLGLAFFGATKLEALLIS